MSTNFEEYITDDQIIATICRIRARVAKSRNKKHLLHKLSLHPKYNYHTKAPNADEVFLQSILPPRRKWKKLNKANRHTSDFQKCNSVEANVNSLLLTIKWYQRNDSSAPFFRNLISFVNDIRESFHSPEFKIQKPQIYPKLKDKKGSKNNVCRPISKFALKDSIMIGIVNRYFTNLFDAFFYDNALAFKSAKIIEGRHITPTHHDAIKEIFKFKQKLNKSYLWVAECDMKAFFDSVSHSVVKRNFKRLLEKSKRLNSEFPDERAIRYFYKYLECYNFVTDVLPANSCREYWDARKIPDGSYGWVKESLVQLGYFKNVHRGRIGIPQGGALSGLIANIVLDFADQKIMKYKDPALGYFRFCDDMILLHPTKKGCKLYVKEYMNSLKSLKLIPHKFEDAKNLKNKSDSFWSKKTKSKGPYRWTADHKFGFPWIGFVGYEIQFSGAIRARKSSLKKELGKQKQVIQEVIFALTKKRPEISNATFLESAMRRLIGMSIGRGEFWNMTKIMPEMCWTKGYSQINDNRHSRKQARLLDRKRNYLISILQKELENIAEVKDIEKREANQPRRYVYYGKPYSYFFHVISKRNQ